MLSHLLLLPKKFAVATILHLFTGRVHTNLVQYRWAKLWYLLRFHDRRGSGYVQLPVALIAEQLAVAPSTIYEWLRLGDRTQREEGETKPGAFRRWRVSGGILKVALGSLEKITLALGLKNLRWGFTAEIPIFEIGNLRALATGIVAQKLQQRSRHLAWENLPKPVREKYKSLPHADEFFHANRRPSDTPLSGGIRCLLHVGKHRIWVSKGFIPFGANQNAIAYERDISERTVRRHVAKIGMEHRQLVQAKAAYRDVVQGIEWLSESYEAEPGLKVQCFDHLPFGQAVVTEAPGGVGHPHTFLMSSSRVFEYGGKSWLYRANLYNPSFRLRTMAHRIRNYKRLLAGTAKQEGYVLERNDFKEVRSAP